MVIGDCELSEEVIAGLGLRYPNTNVRNELALMALWLAKNPASRPKRPMRFVENWLRKASPKLKAVPKIVPMWWQSDEGTMAQARLLGIEPKRGEEMRAFKERLMKVMKEAA